MDHQERRQVLRELKVGSSAWRCREAGCARKLHWHRKPSRVHVLWNGQALTFRFQVLSKPFSKNPEAKKKAELPTPKPWEKNK